MKHFLERNTENLDALPAENKEKTAWLGAFFTNEDPTADFRSARKTFEELKSAINGKLKELHEEAQLVYTAVFDSLDTEVKNNNVDASCIASRSHKLESLKKLESISSLRLTINEAGSFKSLQLEKIIAEVNRKKGSQGKAEESPVKYKPGGRSKFAIISTQQELDEYLAVLRTDMEKMLKENKKIILE